MNDMGEVTGLIERRGFYFVPPQATIAEASWILEYFRIGSVLVAEEEGEKVKTFLGIATERDFTLSIHQGIPPSAPITEIMTPAEKVVFANRRTGRRECLGLMGKYNIQHLVFKMEPEDSRVVGILSIRDLAFDFANIEEQERLKREGYHLTVS